MRPYGLNGVKVRRLVHEKQVLPALRFRRAEKQPFRSRNRCKQLLHFGAGVVDAQVQAVPIKHQQSRLIREQAGQRAGMAVQNFGNDVALKKLDEIEDRIRQLGENPDLGIDPRYLVLKRQGYKVLILEKDLVFYKVNEARKEVIIYAVVDQRQDYLNIIRGL